MRSWIAFFFALLGSVGFVALQIALFGHDWRDLDTLPWILPFPPAIAALPLIVRRSWVRVFIVLPMSFIAFAGFGGALPYFGLAWGATVYAAVQPDPHPPEGAAKRRRWFPALQFQSWETFKKAPVQRSWSAFRLTLLGSLVAVGLWVVLKYEWSDLPWALAVPPALAALPLLVQRSWARVSAAFLLTVFTFSSGFVVFFAIGWIASLYAAAQPDPIPLQDARHSDGSSTTDRLP